MRNKQQRGPWTNQPGKPAREAGVTSRCGHCSGPGKRRKVFFVRRRKRDVYEEVKEIVRVMRTTLLRQPPVRTAPRSVCKEDLSVRLGVTEGCVVQALHRLNREGLVSQRHNKPLHDTDRDRWSGGGSGWAASWYTVLLPKEPPYA